jgi:hypothetical protein
MANASFLFHNTHSLPDQADGSPTVIDAGNARTLNTLTPNLNITFTDADGPSEEHVIASLFPSATQTTEPLQSLKSWDAPFFLADGRHVFYVRTTSTSVLKTDPASGSFGPGDLGPLIHGVMSKLGIDEVIHRPLGGDPGPIEMHVSEDANIAHLLTGTRTVQYGAAKIGASGVLGGQTLNSGRILP